MNDKSHCAECGERVAKGAAFCPRCGSEQPLDTRHGPYTRNPFDILQISPQADDEVIEAAYRGLARKYHPDRGGGGADSELMKELDWAYSELEDPERKEKWRAEAQKAGDQPGNSRHSARRTPPSNADRSRWGASPSGRSQGETATAREDGGRKYGGCLIMLVVSALALLLLARSGINDRSTRPRASSTGPQAQTPDEAFSSPSRNTPRPQPSNTAAPSPTPTGSPTHSAASGLDECIPWDSIEIVHFGDEICIYGRLDRVYGIYHNSRLMDIAVFDSEQESPSLRGDHEGFERLQPGSCIAAVGNLRLDPEGGSYMDIDDPSSQIFDVDFCD